MKITKAELKEIIREELEQVNEASTLRPEYISDIFARFLMGGSGRESAARRLREKGVKDAVLGIEQEIMTKEYWAKHKELVTNLTKALKQSGIK